MTESVPEWEQRRDRAHEMFDSNLVLAVNRFQVMVLRPEDPDICVVVLRAGGFPYDGRDIDSDAGDEQLADEIDEERIAFVLRPDDTVVMVTRLVETLMRAGYGKTLIGFMQDTLTGEGRHRGYH